MLLKASMVQENASTTLHWTKVSAKTAKSNFMMEILLPQA
jgi:hypothetical protein